MTEKKKRGLLSWLGFGEEDQAQASHKETEQSEAQSAGVETTQIDEAPLEGASTTESIDLEATEANLEPELPPAEVEQPEVQVKPTESFFARLTTRLKGLIILRLLMT